ncbi:MAG TPA: prepilin peptidase [Syntrophaceae bacterium]|nr:prepilin peptidase [Syntrophaceae bacterium]
MYYLFHILAFVLGAIVGSFLNVCIHRIPRGDSIIKPSSHCPACNQPISFFDNIPLISYLLLRGRCRHCHTHISFRYPLVELLSALLSLGLFLKFGLSPHLFVYLILAWSLVAVTFIDLDTQTIPDVITLSGIIFGFFASFLILQVKYWQLALGILLGGGILYMVAFLYHALTKKEGMGGGDIKLMAMIGAFLGYESVLPVIFLASLIGSLVGIIIMMGWKKDRRYAIPFGPFLALSTLMYIFCGQDLVRWYALR